MKRILSCTAALTFALCSLPAPAAEPLTDSVRHSLSVRIDPPGHRIAVRDRITLGTAPRDETGAYRFVLHAGLEPKVVGAGWRLENETGPVTASFVGIDAATETTDRKVPLEGWRLIAAASGPGKTVQIEYGGTIHHPLDSAGEEYQRGFSETPGIIDDQGVLLSGTSFWVPTFGDQLVAFDLEVLGLAPPWDVVSQGKRTRHETDADGKRATAWDCPKPMEEIYLVAGPWTEYADRAGQVDLHAFLRAPDPALASRYLEAGKRYLSMYESILPPYPFGSFSLVENFWETGYGMPGFTLLGPKVIRFPWILTSSWPHELLHNWWGNSVYVDMDEGNWCEGLTAYMADHMFDEQKGEGATYRRTTLQKYTDFVREGKDFPLSEFRSRRSAATEAVGYGKSLMLYHMIRRAAGDDAFLAGLSRFAADNKFTRARFSDIAEALSGVTGSDWRPFFRTWTTRAGAPRIEIQGAQVSQRAGAGWQVQVRIRQAQAEDPFPMTVPVAVTLEARDEPVLASVPMGGREASVVIDCPARPLRIDVDPAFDLMRRLDPGEVPPALSALFGEDDPLFVLPSRASPEESAAWRDLAAAWRRPGAPRIVLDSELKETPPGTVWVLGWDNLLRGEILDGLEDQGIVATDAGVAVAGERIDRKDRSVVLVARRGGDAGAAAAWVAADPPAAVPGLARKLPHYTRYSYLVFRGEEPDNTAKGMWQPTSSPMVRGLGSGPLPALRLPPRKPLARLPATFDAVTMGRAVEHIASEAMGGRGIGKAGLEAATAWVERQFEEIGLVPAGEQGFRQAWTAAVGAPPTAVELANLIGLIPGADPNLQDRPLLVLAHLDHLGLGESGARSGNEGKVHPGADDNASGVATLLGIARYMAEQPRPARPVLFAAVTGEESGLLGSRHLLQSLAGRDPFACVNLDTVGRLRDGKLYVLNTDSAREWRFIFMGVQATTGVPIAIVPEPLDASDQVACIEKGVPAIQIFTGPNADYHRPGDTAEKIDAEGLAQVAEVAHEAIAYLAGRPEPLTVKPGLGETAAAPSGAAPQPAPPTSRRASLGTVPDFSFAGPGVRVQEVVPGSPAEAAGLSPGDLILAIDGMTVGDLRAYSEILKSRAPEDTIVITIRRGDRTVKLSAKLTER